MPGRLGGSISKVVRTSSMNTQIELNATETHSKTSMSFESRNPATGELLGTYPEHNKAEIEVRLQEEGMKDQKKIRLGLIGVGNWALFAHVRVLRLLPEYEIVAIYSQRKEAAKAAATEYGIPHVAESLDALVRDPLVAQVLVLTTSQQHEEGIRAAITAGKDVYCEWPLTPTAAKSAELATLADAAGVKTQIGLQRQFAPAFRYVHDLVAQGYVGKVR